MKQHTIINLTIAVLVPTFIFIGVILGVQYTNLPTNKNETIGCRIAKVKADISLTPYLKFEPIENCAGYNYGVDLKGVFPNSGLKGLIATTPDFNSFYNASFLCYDGHDVHFLGDSTFLAKQDVTGEYFIVSNENVIKLGRSTFDITNNGVLDNLWYSLSSSKALTIATIIMLVSLALIILSNILYHPKTNYDSLQFLLPIILGGIWLYMYNSSYGEYKFYESPNLVTIYIFLCWICTIIALFIPLEEKGKLLAEEEREQRRLSNGIDCQYIYGAWNEVGADERSLVFNEDKTAFYTDETKIDFYSYTVNKDWSVILTKGEERYFVRHWYRSRIHCPYLIFDGKTFTRSGKSIDEMQKEYDEKEKQKKQEEEKGYIIDSIVGRHSGGNIIISIFLILLGFVTFLLWFNNSNVFFLLCFIGMFIWGVVRCYHKYLSKKKEKLIPICNKTYGKLSKEKLVEYLRYCLKHGEVSIEEFSNNSQKS